MKSITDLNQYLCLVKQASMLYNILLERAAIASGITKQEADVLAFLINNPMMNTAREMVQYRGFSKAYVSKAVDKLINNGFLSVEVNRTDRRVQHLLTTNKAAEIAARIRDEQAEFLSILTAGVTEKDSEACVSVIRKLYKNACAANNKI